MCVREYARSILADLETNSTVEIWPFTLIDLFPQSAIVSLNRRFLKIGSMKGNLYDRRDLFHV